MVSSDLITDEEMTLIYKYRILPACVQKTIKEMCDSRFLNLNNLWFEQEVNSKAVWLH